MSFMRRNPVGNNNALAMTCCGFILVCKRRLASVFLVSIAARDIVAGYPTMEEKKCATTQIIPSKRDPRTASAS